MTKLTQLTGDDCFRTCLACLLNFNNPESVPNFADTDNSDDFIIGFRGWLASRDYQYVELKTSALEDGGSPLLSDGLCIMIGKSPRGDLMHAVIGKVESVNLYDKLITAVHDPHPDSDGVFLDGNPEYLGFLTKRLVQE